MRRITASAPMAPGRAGHHPDAPRWRARRPLPGLCTAQSTWWAVASGHSRTAQAFELNSITSVGKACQPFPLAVDHVHRCPTAAADQLH